MIVRTKHVLALLVLTLIGLIEIPVCAQGSVTTNWNFVSIPDFLNKDAEFPQRGFEEGLSFFLQSVKRERPEFVLIPGDLIDGHWPSTLQPSQEAIIASAGIYYTAWKERFDHHGLKYYATVGDHEIGDNPWPPGKAELVPLFKEQFTKHLHFPRNGPAGFQGTSYWFLHKNTLFIALDVFTEGKGRQGGIVADIRAGHLKWVAAVLEKHKGATFKIVMGHTPILGPVAKRNSSGLRLERGETSDLWRLMSKHQVDLYLCGEVHAITCTEKDGTNQIAHGSLIGWNATANYLLVEIAGNSLKATLKEIDVIAAQEGKRSVAITITEEARNAGFKTVGTLEINKHGAVGSKVKSGCFGQ